MSKLTEQEQANLNRISELLAELKPLVENAEKLLAKNTIAQTEPIKEERWKPALNEKFWYLLRDFSVHYDNLDHTSAHYIANSLNCFPTEVAAKIAADKIKQLLKEL